MSSLKRALCFSIVLVLVIALCYVGILASSLSEKPALRHLLERNQRSAPKLSFWKKAKLWFAVIRLALGFSSTSDILKVPTPSAIPEGVVCKAQLW